MTLTNIIARNAKRADKPYKVADSRNVHHAGDARIATPLAAFA